MIKILAIGNSFSQDATYYLHKIAAADQIELKVVNLYIGGCSLKQHWENIQSGAAEYLYEENGESTGEYISIPAALHADDWDYIVTQQASHDSGLPETYHPYSESIADYVKAACPKAEFLMQETWAYEIDSLHSLFGRYHHSQAEMYQKLSEAYRTTAAQLGLRLIPCGDVIQALRKKEPFIYEEGGMSICRDGFHMNIIYGRYVLAATWYRTLFGRSLSTNTYIPSTPLAPNATCNEKILQVVKETIDKVMTNIENNNLSLKEIYLAGGCFWGTQHYFDCLPGVIQTEVGYANGKTANPTYEQVKHENTGHAETVKVLYHPEEISLPSLLEQYYKVIDPVSVNRQGGDIGIQYRTGIYYTDPAEKAVIDASLAELQKHYDQKLAVEALPLSNFYTAEEYHQKYLEKNPGGYCHISPVMFEMARNYRPEKN